MGGVLSQVTVGRLTLVTLTQVGGGCTFDWGLSFRSDRPRWLGPDLDFLVSRLTVRDSYLRVECSVVTRNPYQQCVVITPFSIGYVYKFSLLRRRKFRHDC